MRNEPRCSPRFPRAPCRLRTLRRFHPPRPSCCSIGQRAALHETERRPRTLGAECSRVGAAKLVVLSPSGDPSRNGVAPFWIFALRVERHVSAGHVEPRQWRAHRIGDRGVGRVCRVYQPNPDHTRVATVLRRSTEPDVVPGICVTPARRAMPRFSWCEIVVEELRIGRRWSCVGQRRFGYRGDVGRRTARVHEETDERPCDDERAIHVREYVDAYVMVPWM